MTKKRFLNFSVFDLTVAVIALLLVLILFALNTLGDPARRGAMVVYLYPASGDVPNIWLVPINEPSQAKQITFSAMGIYDFDVSLDGRWIAYSMRDEEKRMRDIYTLDLQTGNSKQITFCADESAECYTPAFHPDGSAIAYIHSTVNSDSVGGYGAPRIWLMDLVGGSLRPLADDSQMIGHSPQWSLDGNSIAFFSADLANPGVMVYNFNPQNSEDPTLNFVPAYNGSVGSLSPNGRSLIFPDLVNRGDQVYTHLKIVDFTQNPPTFRNLTEPNEPIDDIAVQWHPDGSGATLIRRYSDERWTRGYQLYDIDIETGAVLPLLVDEHYSHHFFTWDLTGENLLMQRLPLLQDDGNINAQARPEIWVLNTKTGNLTKITDSAYFPRWVLPR
jgi:dipeptidyl aminopeptidase/acylaminoacyl peptidase